MQIIENIRAIRQSNNFDSPYASFLLPFHEKDPKRTELIEKYKDYENMIIIGIGGSNLGTIAVQAALSKKTNGKQLFFLETPDDEATEDILSEVGTKLNTGEKVVVTVISKSGTTVETMALADRAYRLRDTYGEQVQFVTISDADSKLDTLAHTHGWDRLNLPKMVGGRYSVLPNVGLFPLEFIGIPVNKLVQGARDAILKLLEYPDSFSGIRIAETLREEYQRGRDIYEHWFFAKKLKSLGDWYRQLLAESIGKIQSDGTSVGITPSTAIGTTDLHSIAQLDLAHTENRVISLVSIDTYPVSIVGDSPFTEILPDLRETSHQKIVDAARIGFKKALLQKGVPVFETRLHKDDAYDIGYWLQEKMIEVAYLGELFGVNPFDQGNVEDYKKGMKEELAR